MNLYKKTAILLCVIVGVIGLGLPVSTVSAQEKIPKFVLIQLTLDQTSTLCGSEVFTQCMEFSQARCVELAEKAIEQCLVPLPDQIDPKLLQNESLEQCPQEIYSKEGLSEEKAKGCFNLALEAETDAAKAGESEKSAD